MPGTWRWLWVDVAQQPANAALERMDDESISRQACRIYLVWLHKQLARRGLGTLENTLAAYNAGLGPVYKAGGIPPIKETQAYVAKITRLLAGGVNSLK